MAMTPLAAAQLIRADYRDPGSLDTLARLEIGGVEARICACESLRVLIISGTNSRSDWHDFNFRWWPKPQVSEGDTRKWHRGFLRNSEVVYAFAKGWLLARGPIDAVAGHSLGAAAAQIVGSSLRIATYAFAAPKPLWRDLQPRGAECVRCWCREDDAVCFTPPYVPPLSIFSRVGETIWLKPEDRHRGEDHSIENYLPFLEEDPRPA